MIKKLLIHSKEIECWTDGASRGNPGISGAGVIIKDGHGRVLKEISQFLGNKVTNNVAEYKALILALSVIVKIKPSSVKIYMDSNLIVQQIQGKWRIKDPNLKISYNQAIEHISKLKKFEIIHIRRHLNKEADALANKAIDGNKFKKR